MQASSIQVGLIGFDGVNAIDLVGPAEVFANAAELDLATGAPQRYEIVIIGINAKPFIADSGIVFKPHRTLAAVPRLDTLIVPGGSGLRRARTQAVVAAWLRSHTPKIRRVCSVCTGIYGLAAAGLLDGRRVTTHWRWARAVAELFPRLHMDPNAIFVQDGKFFTSGGVTAGMDLALALVEQDFGPRLALSTAREIVIYLKRDGGQEQFSEPLRFQVAASSDRLAHLGTWITTHLRHELSVEVLAEKACLSPRQLSRRFKLAFGKTPADFVEMMRLDAARERLSSGRHSPIAEIAESVGFASADAFRRAFERRFGVPPRSYRERFVLRRANLAG